MIPSDPRHPPRGRPPHPATVAQARGAGGRPPHPATVARPPKAPPHAATIAQAARAPFAEKPHAATLSPAQRRKAHPATTPVLQRVEVKEKAPELKTTGQKGFTIKPFVDVCGKLDPKADRDKIEKAATDSAQETLEAAKTWLSKQCEPYDGANKIGGVMDSDLQEIIWNHYDLVYESMLRGQAMDPRFGLATGVIGPSDPKKGGEGMLVIIYRDFGPGLPFLRGEKPGVDRDAAEFFNFKKSEKKKEGESTSLFGGMGIGLSRLVKDVAEGGGHVTVGNPTNGQGALFKLWFKVWVDGE